MTSGRISWVPNGDQQRRTDGEHRRQGVDAADRPPGAVDEEPGQRRARARTRSDPRPRTGRSWCRGGPSASRHGSPPASRPCCPAGTRSASRRSPSATARARARRAANTTASTSALRTMTALRLYLSAHTPHSGTSGSPTTKISELYRPDERDPVRLGDAELAQVRRQQGEHLAHAHALDELRDPEGGDRDAPVLTRSQRFDGHGVTVPEGHRRWCRGLRSARAARNEE